MSICLFGALQKNRISVKAINDNNTGSNNSKCTCKIKIFITLGLVLLF